MKITITMKDPDILLDGVRETLEAMSKPEGVSDKEWSQTKETRVQEQYDLISAYWMKYGEYLRVEFDTEAYTATVVRI